MFKPKDVDEAVQMLREGKRIEFEQPDQVSTLVDKLADVVKEAEAKGDKAPNFDLCKVSVKGTNLFCVESKGIPRIKMPQLSGAPIAGSKADKLEKDDKGEVNITPQFLDFLKSRGVAIAPGQIQADHLRASQMELNGGKVAGMAKAIRAGKLPPGAIVVSRDNYVVDGHHRWAAEIAVDLDDNKPGDLSMDTAKVDMTIIQLLAVANNFAHSWGIGQKAV